MDLSCLVSTVQAGAGGVMVLHQTEHCLNITAFLNIVADHVHPIMTTVYLSCDGYLRQDIAPFHKAQTV